MDKKSRDLVMGKLYMKNKDYKMAERSFYEHLSTSPEDYQALKMLAQVQEHLNDTAKAFDMYQRCYLAQPDRKGVLLDICRLLLIKDSRLDHVDQKKWLKLAAQSFPTNPIVTNLRETLPVSQDSRPGRITTEDMILEKLTSLEDRFRNFEDRIKSIEDKLTEQLISSTLQQPNHVHPKFEQPKVEQPKLEQPKVEQPKIDQPKVEQPKIEQPKIEQPKIEQPKFGQLKFELPKLEQLNIQQPKTEPPTIEQPKTEQPKFEPSKLNSSSSVFSPSLKIEAKPSAKTDSPFNFSSGVNLFSDSLKKDAEPAAPNNGPFNFTGVNLFSESLKSAEPAAKADGPLNFTGVNLFAESMKKMNLPSEGQWTLPKATTTKPDKEEGKGEEYDADDNDSEVVNNEELPIESFCDMKPIEIKSGEEDEDLLFEFRCKLFRFRDKEYKERGLGNIKVLKHKETGKGRLIMRREQINLVCLNCRSCTKIERVRDTQVRFAGLDASDGEAVSTIFLAKFGTSEKTDEFLKHLNELFTGDD